MVTCSCSPSLPHVRLFDVSSLVSCFFWKNRYTIKIIDCEFSKLRLVEHSTLWNITKIIVKNLVRDPPSSLRDVSLSQRMGTSQVGQNKFTSFPRWMFISDRDGIINLHQVSTSQQEADIDDNRPMTSSSDASKSKNRCQNPRLSSRSIYWNKSRNQEELFLMKLAFCRLQRTLTRPVPSWANFPVIVKRMSCHEYKIQVWTLKRHTQTGIKTHCPASSHVRRPHCNRCTVVHLWLCPDFLMYGVVTHKFLLTL